MNKLEVGMYVRTNTGIHKIFEIDEKKTVWKYKCDKKSTGEWDGSYEYTLLKEEQIIGEPSYNKIDLIEVGDYVNGCYVSNKRASVNEHLGGHPKGIGIIKCNAYFNQGNYDDCKFVWIEEKDIKSILTKEQFERMEYKI